MAHYVDLQSATNSINSDLLRAVSKFVETSHWKEALKILKLAVTRSSTLVAPPSTSHISNPHHWEPHTSFAEAEVYFKKELPGRTMEFTFDLSQTPVIERRHRRAGLANYGLDSREEAATSPRRSLSLSTADSSTFSGWKRPWMSQSRVRECLVNLLSVCGQKVGLPKSPSVIFSQASELLERQSSMASSTECVSGPGNDVSTEQSKHDTTDTEQRFGMYMRDFDFLEYELESLEGESVDNFNWGVRRPSLTNLDGELIGGIEREVRDRHDHKLHRPEGESSDEELGSVSPVDDLSARSGGEHSGASSSVSTTSSGVFPPSSLPGLQGRARVRSITPNSETESGECSEGEMSDLTPCNASPSLSQLLSWTGCRRLERNDVEESWRGHVQTLMTASSQANLLHTFALFGRLFRDLRSKTVGLTEDSCAFLVRDGSSFSHQLRGAVAQFETLLGVLGGVPECPHVWCDFTLLCNPHLTERIKFNVLEIQENFDNYVDKKDTTLSCLEALKAHVKLLSMGDSVDSGTNLEADQVELCRFLYKLHFQQLLLLESYTKLLQLLSGAASSSGVVDLSSEVAAVRSSLLGALSDTLTPPGSPARAASPEVRSTTESPETEEKPADSGVDSPTPKATSGSPTPKQSSPITTSPSSPKSAPGDSSPLTRTEADENSDQGGSGGSPTPRAVSPSLVVLDCSGPVAVTSTPPSSPTPEDGDPTPTEGCSEGEESAPTSISTLVVRTPSPPLAETELMVPKQEVRVPETAEEAEALVVEHLTSGSWKAVWSVWRQSRGLRTEPEEMQSLSLAEKDLADLTAILDAYCRHMADSREGIFVMTVSSVDLGQVCSSLMDISLQLLASVKKLEQSLTQRQPESPSSPSRVESAL